MKTNDAKEKEPDLKKRTKAFAVEVVKFAKSLPRDWVSMTLGKQLLRVAASQQLVQKCLVDRHVILSSSSLWPRAQDS